MSPNTFSERLKYLRNRRGLSQLELAELVGADPVSVSRWERSVSLPLPTYRKRLADALECSVAWLVFGEGEAPLIAKGA